MYTFLGYFFLNNVISFIQILATINTPKVQAPLGVSLLHSVLIIQGTKYINVYRIFVNEYIKRIKENKTLQKSTFLM
jgi:hypothetical protein